MVSPSSGAGALHASAPQFSVRGSIVLVVILGSFRGLQVVQVVLPHTDKVPCRLFAHWSFGLKVGHDLFVRTVFIIGEYRFPPSALQVYVSHRPCSFRIVNSASLVMSPSMRTIYLVLSVMRPSFPLLPLCFHGINVSMRYSAPPSVL